MSPLQGRVTTTFVNERYPGNTPRRHSPVSVLGTGVYLIDESIHAADPGDLDGASRRLRRPLFPVVDDARRYRPMTSRGDGKNLVLSWRDTAESVVCSRVNLCQCSDTACVVPRSARTPPTSGAPAGARSREVFCRARKNRRRRGVVLAFRRSPSAGETIAARKSGPRRTHQPQLISAGPTISSP